MHEGDGAVSSAVSAALLSALRDLAAGRGVKRGRHELRVADEDRSGLFLEALRLEGFVPARVRDVEVGLGERMPAFLVREGRADFGWVFVEKLGSNSFSESPSGIPPPVSVKPTST